MSEFLVTQQKQHLHNMGETLRHIESCDLLGEIDPAYYGNKKQEYILQYAMQLSQLAQSVFKKGVHTPNAVLIGDLQYGAGFYTNASSPVGPSFISHTNNSAGMNGEEAVNNKLYGD
jgi:hypothetical protein